MKMAPPKSKQQGAALMAMLAIVVLGGSYLLISHLNPASGLTVINRDHNAKVLSHAKRALIGHVAQVAARAGENNPGRLPCPEAPGNYGDPTQEGIAAGNCTLPAVGRLPWRTLGLDRLVDSASEPLWYVVSPAWALSNSTTPPLTTLINSHSAGQLAVDGAANDSVALIIAPGGAFAVPAAPGCAAWNQTRPAAGPLELRNYLECENATSPANATFVTVGPSGSFNDQVLRVTTADLLPALEAAIAHRIEREIAPKLKQVYTTANGWTLSPGVALPAGTSLFPFAAAFSDPEASPDPDAANYPDRTVFKGTPTPPNYVGLAPLARHVPGTITWINPATAFTLTLLSGGLLQTVDCSTSTSTVFRCDIVFLVTSGFTLDVDAANIGTGFRAAPGVPSKLTVTGGTPCNPPSCAQGPVSNSLRPDGSARVRIEATPSLLGIVGTVTVQLEINAADPVIDDIALNNAWYLYNDWHKFTLYAVSEGFAPGAVAACGEPNPPCLTIKDSIYPASGQRALLLLAGRILPGQTRPNAILSNYLEGENLAPLDETFRRGAASRTVNDRVVLLAP